MGRLEALSHRLGIQAALLATRLREKAPDALESIQRPSFIDKRVGPVERSGQWLAFFFLPVVVVVSFALMTAFHGVMGTVLFDTWQDDPTDEGLPFIQWLVTLITLGMFGMVAWSWFQFVRTAGFGLFNWK